MTKWDSSFPQSPEALRSFLAIHIERFTRHACYLLGNREDAEDVVQDVIIRAYGMRSELKTVGNPAAYLFKMVSNAAFDQLRRRNTREKAAARIFQFPIRDLSESREDEMIREEELKRAKAMLEQLPGEQAEVIRYRITEDLTFNEIAGLVKAPLTTVKSRFAYGMIKLRSMMKEIKEVTYEM